MIIKAISVKQPWAWLLANGIKDVENRTWSTKHRGPVLIHASKGYDPDAAGFACKWSDLPVPDKARLQFGAVIGIGFLHAVTRGNEFASAWYQGPVGLWIKDARPLVEPWPCPGKLGIFDIDIPENRLPRNFLNCIKAGVH